MNGTILGIVNGKVLYQNNNTKPNRNILVVGGPGSYKTQSVVMTNVFNETENSIVVTDPKGEVFEATARIKIAQGYQVHVINFTNMAHSDRYNPFDYIEKDTNAETVANKIVESENKDSQKDVWFSTQRQLLKALILYVINHRPPVDRNLSGVLNVLQEYDVEPKIKGEDSPLDKLFLSLDMTDTARRAYELGFKKTKGEMKSGVIGSLLATVGKFTDKEVSDFLSFSDFDLKDIGRKKVMLYVIIPVMDSTYESIINLFFSQLFDELYKLASNHGAKLEKPVDFILDEFQNLGKFPKYEEFLATCRGYGIGVTTILQDIAKLRSLYTKERADSILGLNSVKICLNASESETANYFRDLLGKATVKVETGSESTSHSKETSTSVSDSYNYTSRYLMTSDEIMQMPDTQSLIFFNNKRPLKAKKAFQFQLFPNASSLATFNQNDYHYVTEPSQKAKEQNKETEWKEKQLQVEVKKQTYAVPTTEEEDNTLDDMDEQDI
ncbi:type IV secretory system conjugative DNA transfer family protein [Lactococcus cremoris]|uniref:VirD4-like conjugal transfer protein, CD1115 family n=1 Tax=Lactococcus lactis subsp. cremoris TaxID=1359 RepID=UPI0022E12DF1|nr:type IV secretory system conjugative DNA transfer family protein [Lactococcus cremoris]MDA2879988.1 type IV secretory system conjugative DNA transfer family protein [Lactococcus cremoris]MDA2882529.1 type IV secretory system conjugative DNA transfer family protein [Lactococcus cremoris]